MSSGRECVGKRGDTNDTNERCACYAAPMHYFIGHSSSLESWRSPRATNNLLPSRVQPSCFNNLTPKTLATLDLAPFGITESPVHFLVPHTTCRTKARGIVCHVVGGTFPSGSFYTDTGSIFICSPELTFILMAQMLTVLELVTLGFELCGAYALDATSSEGFYKRDPLTSVAALQRYLDRVGPLHGAKKARRALRYITDNSASPMETIVAMLLCLPCSLGGYGIALPQLNSRINICVSGNHRNGKKHYVCDMLWTDHRLSVEYDSSTWHAGEDQITQDSRRRADLIAAGLTVVSITKGQVFDARSFDRAARLLAKRTGKTIRNKNYSEATRRYELRMALLKNVFERHERNRTNKP